jgi:hypothetical protein
MPLQPYSSANFNGKFLDAAIVILIAENGYSMFK